MDRPVTHELVNPEELTPPRGYSHAVVAAPGRLVFLAGQTAHQRDGKLPGDDFVEQFDAACANVATALSAAGGRPEDLVSMQIFVTDVDEYNARRGEIGDAWQRHLGKHYPAAALIGVARLVYPDVKVELMGIAVVPDR
ncbi:MAG: RidA family protein [Actinomycetota bacterium]